LRYALDRIWRKVVKRVRRKRTPVDLRQRVVDLYDEAVQRGIIDRVDGGDPLRYHEMRPYADRYHLNVWAEGGVDTDGGGWSSWYSAFPMEHWARHAPKYVPANVGVGRSMTEAVLRCLLVSDDNGILRAGQARMEAVDDEWVSVRKDLPDADEEVLVYIQGYRYPRDGGLMPPRVMVVFLSGADKDGAHWHHDDLDHFPYDGYVTHWRRIPSAPKEE
jgi:hypothetical protein